MKCVFFLSFSEKTAAIIDFDCYNGQILLIEHLEAVTDKMRIGIVCQERFLVDHNYAVAGIGSCGIEILNTICDGNLAVSPIRKLSE